MNINEACALLGVAIGASDADVKTAFKKKAIEFHPDRNKSPDAEDKFKQINAAFQFIEKHGTTPPSFDDIKSPFYNSSDHLAEELQRRINEAFYKPNINAGIPLAIGIEIPFKTAIFGGQQSIYYSRKIKCEACVAGKQKTVCQKCNGSGKRKYGGQASDKELPCTSCIGIGFIYSGICNICNGSNSKINYESFNIDIKPGTINGTKLTFNSKGNHIIKDWYGDLIVNIDVKASPDGLTISGNDVISVVELTLLEALKGTKKSLCTIKGEKTLEFKPKIKNGDKIRVSGFGVPPNGAHIFTISVTYPEDVSGLIKILEEEIEKESVSTKD